ncbi:MAG: hypothetical protein Q8O72_11380 [Bacteroidales bacterium]|nr:hypothetical protein [Bacteroidales bacterium]
MTKLKSIPFLLKIKILFSNKLVYTGLFVLSISGMILATFIPNLDLYSARFEKEDVNKVTGVLTAISETNTKVNKDRIYLYSYEFVNNAETIFGHSYGKLKESMVNDTVPIEYLRNEINVSRIIGTKNGSFSIDFSYMLLEFLFIGLLLTFYPLYQQVKFLKTLKSGFEIVTSNFDSEFKFPNIPNTKTNPYYRLKFKYSIGNREYKKAVFAQLDDLHYRRIRLSNILVDSKKHNKGYIVELFPVDLKKVILK